MVLLGDEQQQDAVPQLDAVQRGDAHVEEDSEQSGHGDHLQYGLHQDGQAWGGG